MKTFGKVCGIPSAGFSLLDHSLEADFSGAKKYARMIVEQMLIKTSTAFSGGAISAYSLTVGIIGNQSKYLTAFDAFAAVAGSNYNLTSISNAGDDLNASESIKLFATSVGANLNASTAGSVDIWIKTSGLP